VDMNQYCNSSESVSPCIGSLYWTPPVERLGTDFVKSTS